jgi:hypothetical protein
MAIAVNGFPGNFTDGADQPVQNQDKLVKQNGVWKIDDIIIS